MQAHQRADREHRLVLTYVYEVVSPGSPDHRLSRQPQQTSYFINSKRRIPEVDRWPPAESLRLRSRTHRTVACVALRRCTVTHSMTHKYDTSICEHWWDITCTCITCITLFTKRLLMTTSGLGIGKWLGIEGQFFFSFSPRQKLHYRNVEKLRSGWFLAISVTSRCFVEVDNLRIILSIDIRSSLDFSFRDTCVNCY